MEPNLKARRDSPTPHDPLRHCHDLVALTCALCDPVLCDQCTQASTGDQESVPQHFPVFNNLFFFPPHIPFYIQVTFFFKGNKLEICFSLFFFLLYRFIHEVKTKTQNSNQNNKNLCTLIFTLFIFFFFLQCKYCVLSHTIALIASWHSHTSVTPIGRPNSVTHELGRENSKLTQFTVHSLWQYECP